MSVTDAQKQKLLARLRRAEGQVAAIRRMIEADSECVAVLTQVSAARGALGRVGQVVLQHHIETCMTGGFDSGQAEGREAQVQELMDVFRRYGGLGG